MSLYPLLLTFLLTNSDPALQMRSSYPVSAEENLLPLLIYFHSSACGECASLDNFLNKPEVMVKMEQRYVSAIVSLDNAEGKACAEIYHIDELPGLVIADRKGSILYKSNGSLTIEDVSQLIEVVPAADTDESPEIEKPIVASPSAPSVKSEAPAAKAQANKPIGNTSAHVPVVNANDEHLNEKSVNTVKPSSSPSTKSTTYVSHTQEVKKAKQIIVGTSAKPVSSTPVSSENMATAEKAKASSSKSTTGGATKAVRQYVYSVQLAYFSEETNAKAFMKKIGASGVTDARIEYETRDSKPYFRILAGRFNTLTAAQKLLADIHGKGLKGAVHRQ